MFVCITFGMNATQLQRENERLKKQLVELETEQTAVTQQFVQQLDEKGR